MPAAFTDLDWYDTPRYYDMVFDEDTALEAEFLETMVEQHATCARRRQRRAYEPACGSGRLLVALAERGWGVAGADLSRPMLDYARGRLAENGLRGSLAVGDMSTHTPRGRFELAHCLVSTFKYLTSEAAAQAHLERVAQALLPGGIYVLGFHLTDYTRTAKSRERWSAEDGDTAVVCTIQTWPANRGSRLEQMRSRLVVTEAGEERRSETSWNFRTYDPRQVRRLLARVPTLEHVATYDFRYDAGEPCEFGVDQEDTLLILRRRHSEKN